jgi:hypothetical protein
VEFPAAVITQLDTLSEALDDVGTDLHAVLAVLVDDLLAAVPSFLGLSITVVVQGQPVTITTIDPSSARGSLLLPLVAISDLATGGNLTFYAAGTDACVDLAVDVRTAYALDGEVVLDRDVPTTPEGRSRGEHEVLELCEINQAIGVLIEQGYPPDRARAELDHRSAAAGMRRQEAARRVLGGIAVPAGVADEQGGTT